MVGTTVFMPSTQSAFFTSAAYEEAWIESAARASKRDFMAIVLLGNLIPGILKPYIGICKHLPLYGAAGVAGRGPDGFLLYHTASLPGSHCEGRFFRIRPRRFACRGLRIARDARRLGKAHRRRPEPGADDGDAAGAPRVPGRHQRDRRSEIRENRKGRRAHRRVH